MTLILLLLLVFSLPLLNHGLSLSASGRFHGTGHKPILPPSPTTIFRLSNFFSSPTSLMQQTKKQSKSNKENKWLSTEVVLKSLKGIVLPTVVPYVMLHFVMGHVLDNPYLRNPPLWFACFAGMYLISKSRARGNER